MSSEIFFNLTVLANVPKIKNAINTIINSDAYFTILKKFPPSRNRFVLIITLTIDLVKDIIFTLKKEVIRVRKLVTTTFQTGSGSLGITLPRTVRDILEIEKGTKFQIYVDNHKGEESIIMRKLDNYEEVG